MKLSQGIGIVLVLILSLIFIPSWLILSLLGICLVLVLTGSLGKIFQLKETTTKILTILSMVSLLISIGWTVGERMYPPLFNALNARHIFLSYEATDLVDPRYPLKLPLAIQQAERAKLRAEETKLSKTLDEIRKKRDAGVDETNEEREFIEYAKKRLPIIEQEMEKLRLVSADVKRPSIISTFSLTSKLIIFGLILLAPGMIFSKGFLKGFGVLFLIGGIGWGLFGKDVSGSIKSKSANIPNTPNTASIEKILKPSSPAEGGSTFRVPAGEIVNTALKFEAGDMVEYIQEENKTFWIVNRDIPDIKITSQRTVKEGLSRGKITLRGGSELTTVTVTITPRSQNIQTEESIKSPIKDPIKKAELVDIPPKREPELLFFGKDLNRLTFVENAYLSKGPHWKIQLTSAEILNDGNLRLNFLHTSIGGYKEVMIWIENPESTTYITDNLGRRYNFIREENLGTHTGNKGTWLGGNIFPRDVPVAYSMVFTPPPEGVREINFVSRYFPCVAIFSRSARGHGCVGAFPESVTLRGIKLFKEKG